MDFTVSTIITVVQTILWDVLDFDLRFFVLYDVQRISRSSEMVSRGGRMQLDVATRHTRPFLRGEHCPKLPQVLL